MASSVTVSISAEYPAERIPLDGPYMLCIPRSCTLEDLKGPIRSTLGLSPAAALKVQPISSQAPSGWSEGDRFLVTLQPELKKSLGQVEVEGLRAKIARLQAQLTALEGQMQMAKTELAKSPPKAQPPVYTSNLSPIQRKVVTPSRVGQAHKVLVQPSNCVGQQMLNVDVYDIETKQKFSLLDALNGLPAVIDFWSTTCPNCPAAVNRADLMAAMPQYKGRASFLAVNTNDLTLARVQIKSEQWGNLKHFHVTLEDKERLKAFLGMKQLPYHVMLDKNGKVLLNGKQFAWDKFEQIMAAEEASLGSGSSPILSIAKQQKPEPPTYAGRQLRFSESDCHGEPVPDVRVVSILSGRVEGLKTLLKGMHSVIELWSTTSQDSLASVAQAEEFAARCRYGSDVQCIYLNVDDRVAARAVAQQRGWNASRVFFTPHDDCEKLKEFLGARQIPFRLLLDQDAEVLVSGQTCSWPAMEDIFEKKFPALKSTGSLDTQSSVPMAPSTPAHVFSLDEDF